MPNSTWGGWGMGAIYRNSLFVICGGAGFGNTNKMIAYSSDAINWTYSNTTILSAETRMVEYNGTNKWVAVGTNANPSTTEVAYVTDITSGTWSSSINPYSNRANYVKWGNGKFIINGYDNVVIYTSSDGANWTSVSSSNFQALNGPINWNNNLWLMGQTSSSKALLYSNDNGATWGVCTITSCNVIYAIAYAVPPPYVVGTAPTINSITTTGNTFNINFTPGTGGIPDPTTYYYSLNNGATYTNANATASPIVLTLPPDITYYFTLIATNTAGNTVASNVVIANTHTVNDKPTASVCEYYFNDSLNNKIKNYKTFTYDLSLVNVGVSSPTISAASSTVRNTATYSLYQNTVSTSAYSYYVNDSSVIKSLTGSFSISFWFYLDPSASFVGLIWSLYDPSTNNLITYTQGGTADGGIICIRIGSSSFYVQNANALANQYNHIVFTFFYISATSGLIQVYTNGTLTPFNSGNSSGNKPNVTWSGTNINTLNASPFSGNTILYLLGGPAGTGLSWPANSASFSNGQMCYVSNFVIYNTVLTSNEITYLRNNVFFPPYPCFLEGSKILCLDPDSDTESYVAVEKLRRGDLIKTSMDGYKAISFIGRATLENPVDDPDKNNRLYVFKKSTIKGMTEDLCLTGEHCTLRLDITESHLDRIREHMGRVYITDDRFRCPACLDERAFPYEGEGPATIWHFALEHDNAYWNYGVYANGLLVESCSIEHLVNRSKMMLVY